MNSCNILQTMLNLGDQLAHHIALHRPLQKLGDWMRRSLLKFIKGKHGVLQLRQNNPKHQYRQGSDGLRNSPAEKTQGVAVEAKKNMSQSLARC